jgi:hypothetical protein
VKKLLGLMGAVPVAAPVVVSVGPLSPDAVSGLALWLKADALSLNDADPVSTWTDSSGNGRNFTQTGTARPTYKTTAGLFPTNKPVVRFDGVDDYLASAAIDLSSASAVTLILVTASVSATAAQYVLCEYGENYTANAGQLCLLRNAAYSVTVASKSAAAGVTADMTTDTTASLCWLVKTTPRVVAATFDKSLRSEQAVAYINGVWGGGAVSSNTGRTNNDSGSAFAASQPVYLGARHASGVPTLFAPMDVAEVLLYTRKLSVRELVRLHMWLDDKYDVLS